MGAEPSGDPITELEALCDPGSREDLRSVEKIFGHRRWERTTPVAAEASTVVNVLSLGSCSRFLGDDEDPFG